MRTGSSSARTVLSWASTPAAMEKVRRRLKAVDDSDRQMVVILACLRAHRRADRRQGRLPGGARSRRLIGGRNHQYPRGRDPAPVSPFPPPRRYG